MHIPDGFLSTPVWAALDAISLPAVALVARGATRETDHSSIPLLGVMGAFVFAAQMINFPVGLGTSGHLVGGALLGMVLGPWAAVVVMTAIVALQAFVFQDGGILAIGANLFNMAIAGVVAGYLPYQLFGQRWRQVAVFAGGTLSVLVGAALALAELRLSGVTMPVEVLGISAGFFLVSALLEGAITLAAFNAIERLRPRSIATQPAAPGVVATAAVVLAVFGILVASTAPDGIERLAALLGLQELAGPKSFLAGYEFSALPATRISRAAAGLTGLVLIWGLCIGAGRWIARKSA